MKPFALRGGVDLISPRPFCAPGALQDCYNYEVNTQIGYAPIDGFEAFDGRMSPSTRDIWELTLATASITGTFVANENMSWVSGSDTGNLGVVISVSTVSSNTVIRFAYWNPTDALPSGATVTGDTSGATFSATPTFAALEDVATDADDYFDQLKAAANILRGAITPVPGSGTVHGIKWYKNQQTAIRDYFKFNFDTGTTAEPEVGRHVLIVDGDAGTTFGDEGIIRELTVDSGTFGGGNAAGTVVIEPLNNAFDFGTNLGTAVNDLVPLVEIYFTSGSTEPTVGQVLEGATSSETATVYRVVLQDGTWSGGDAEGVIYCTGLSGTLTDGENMDLVSPSTANVLTVDADYPSNYTGTGSAVMSYVSTDTDGHSMAGMYRSSRTGWDKVDLGYEVAFDSGENEPVGWTASGGATRTAWTAAGTQRDLGGWQSSSGTELDAVASKGGGVVNPSSGSLTTVGSYEVSDEFFCIRNFGFSLPTDAVVTGIEVRIYASTTLPSEEHQIIEMQPYYNDAGDAEGGSFIGVMPKDSETPFTATDTEYFFGGQSDLFGAFIDKSVVEDANFGIKFKGKFLTGGFTTRFDLDQVVVRVHYTSANATKVYIYDTGSSADYATADLLQTDVSEGFWNGTAAGTFLLYNLTRPILTTSMEIYTGPGATGDLIADVAAQETLVSLPGTTLLAAEESKYQMIVENVYASQDLEAIYGASGAGRAFVYEGNYVMKLYSGLSETLDKPRHVAIYQFRVWLAYEWGELAASVAGNPLSFDGTLNAAATGVGRVITGLTAWPGQILGVLTKTGVYGIKVAGSEFDQQLIAPGAGAIEYTVQDAGTQPIFADSRGVKASNTTDAYGDFQTNRISDYVSNWLLPRLQNRVVSSARNQHVVNTSLSRAKNQYRMYFADGYRMSITLNPEPEITFQQLYTGADPDQYVRVLATDSDVDDLSTDRVFFTMDVNPDYDHGADLGYVYEDDRGTSFNGDTIKRWVELAPLSDLQIADDTTWGTWHLYGEAHGYAALQLTTALDLATPADADVSSEDSLYSIELGATSNDPATKQKAYRDKARMKKNGMYLSMRFQSTTDKELPHVLQTITLVDEKKARRNR